MALYISAQTLGKIQDTFSKVELKYLFEDVEVVLIDSAGKAIDEKEKRVDKQPKGNINLRGKKRR